MFHTDFLVIDLVWVATVCGNGNTMAKIDYLTLTMHIFAAVRLFFLF